jgi:hypothetical protein
VTSLSESVSVDICRAITFHFSSIGFLISR